MSELFPDLPSTPPRETRSAKMSGHARNEMPDRHYWMRRVNGELDTEKCGDCVFLRGSNNRTAKNYFKCMKSKVSASAATDWRKKWLACGLFKKKD